jgi:C-terminal processing protease CtpA/Prc
MMFFGHMIDEPIRAINGGVPQVLYPDHEHLTFDRDSGSWFIEPLEPKLKGKIIFLCYGGSISRAEMVMGIVEDYHLAEIIGQPTAGVDGDINPFRIIDGFDIYWTGLQVLRQDGSQFHMIGVTPTIPSNERSRK